MKLYSLSVLYKNGASSSQNGSGQAKILRSAHDLSSFGFFQKGSVEEFMKFTSKILAERTETGSRSSVKEHEYMAHVFVRGDNLTVVLFSDQEYPNRVAHTLLNKVTIRIFNSLSYD
jgi:synaptobrevin homolog YKT6